VDHGLFRRVICQHGSHRGQRQRVFEGRSMGARWARQAARGCSMALERRGIIGIGGRITAFAQTRPRSGRSGSEVVPAALSENFGKEILGTTSGSNAGTLQALHGACGSRAGFLAGGAVQNCIAVFVANRMSKSPTATSLPSDQRTIVTPVATQTFFATAA
jgi:hypothetical protein